MLLNVCMYIRTYSDVLQYSRTPVLRCGTSTSTPFWGAGGWRSRLRVADMVCTWLAYVHTWCVLVFSCARLVPGLMEQFSEWYGKGILKCFVVHPDCNPDYSVYMLPFQTNKYVVRPWACSLARPA